MALGEKLRGLMDKIKSASVADKALVKEIVKELQRTLISSDVEVGLVLELSKEIEEDALKDLPKGVSRKEHMVKITYDSLTKFIGGKAHELPPRLKKVLVLGLYGSGKTTSIGKLAKYYQKRGQKIGVIAADIHRPAALEQLEQGLEKIKIPVYGTREEKKAERVVREGLEKFKDYDLVIVDTAGRSGLDKELEKEIKEIRKVLEPEWVFLVLSADIGQAAKAQAKAFHEAVGVNGIILTKMDGSAKGGGALAACNATKAPVYFIGTGEKLSDLEAFDPKRFLARVMGYPDLQGLLERIEESELKAEDVKGLMEGEFTLEAFKKQLEATKKVGSIGKIAGMLGLGPKIPKEMVAQGEVKLKDFEIIMQSMTKQELSNPDIITKSRIQRIAKGSAKTQQEVRELLKQYKQMKKLFKKFKGMNPKAMEKNPMLKMLKGMKI